MPIITLTRGAFSGGPELAERIAAQLGYRCVSREVLMKASEGYGIPEAKFTEILDTAPRWWERWQEGLRLYRIVLQASMCEVAQNGNLVYHGHAGQDLFPGIHHVLRVYLTAPMSYRVEQVRAREGMSDTAALHYIEQVDKARTRRLQALFGGDWRDPSRYDLVINVGNMSLESAAHLIVEASRRPEYQPTADSERAFQDLTIAARVQAALIVSPKTRNLTINVDVESGRVHLSGILANLDLERDIIHLAESVPGVVKVDSEFESPPIEYMYP